VNPDRLAELEEERAFLLRSLTDLEREHAAGDVDDDDYHALRDGYTVRAAAVMRAIDEGRAALPPRPPRNWWRLAASMAVVAAVAVGGGLFVARSSGQRLPGQEITGGIPGGDVAAKLSRARTLLGVDPLGAQQLYGEVLAERPNHPEALAYSGWLLALNSVGASDDVRVLALDTAKSSLRRSIESDDRYADPHCFLAIIAANFEDDVDTALVEFDACLAKDPPAEMRGLVDELVADLLEQAADSTRSVPSPSQP
jgi:hypothetical protein